MMSPDGCPRSDLCAFHHNNKECRVEITKDMEYDYTKALDDEQVSSLQKDFNTPPPIGTDVDATKPAQKKEAGGGGVGGSAGGCDGSSGGSPEQFRRRSLAIPAA